MRRQEVVTAFLESHGRIGLFQRSTKVGTYKRHWAAISGGIEADPLSQAHREIREETGLDPRDLRSPVRGEPVEVYDERLDTVWVVHPFRFRLKGAAKLRLDWEHTDWRWIDPADMRRFQTVPALDRAYRSTLEPARRGAAGARLALDQSSGAAELARDAVQYLAEHMKRSGKRTRRGLLGDLAAAAVEVSDERPSMAAVANAAAAAVCQVESRLEASPTLSSFQAEAARVFERVIDRMSGDVVRSATLAASLFEPGATVVTLSHSSTVMQALEIGAVRRIRTVVLESRPLGEGRRTAELLAAAGIETRLVPDAAAVGYIASADLVLVGADTVLPGGSVVNKVGTRGAALAAREDGVKFYAVCESLKISPSSTIVLEQGPEREVLETPVENLSAGNPRFEATPGGWITGIVTERGILRKNKVSALAAEHRRMHRRVRALAGVV